MTQTRKIIIGVLFLLTLALAGVSVFVALNLTDGDGDVAVSCPGDNQFDTYDQCIIACEAGATQQPDPAAWIAGCPSGCNDLCAANGGTPGGATSTTQNKNEGDSCTPGQSDPATGGCDGPGPLSCIVCPATTNNSGNGVCINNFNSRTGEEVTALCGGPAAGGGSSSCGNGSDPICQGRNGGDFCGGDSACIRSTTTGDCSCEQVSAGGGTCNATSQSNCSGQTIGSSSSCVVPGTNASGICTDQDGDRSCACTSIGAGGTSEEQACTSESTHFWSKHTCNGLEESAGGCQEPGASAQSTKPDFNVPDGFCGWVQIDCEDGVEPRDDAPEYFESRYICTSTGSGDSTDTTDSTDSNDGVDGSAAVDLNSSSDGQASGDDSTDIVDSSTFPYCGDGVCTFNEACEFESGSTTVYRECTQADITNGTAPTGNILEECREIATTRPAHSNVQSENACSYCGDGTVQDSEQCDYNAPGAGGENCNEQCQQVTLTCQSLTENGPDPIQPGVGNTILYTVEYQAGSTFNVNTLTVRVGNTAVGRDANNIGSALVSPASSSYEPSTSVWTVNFVWEAAEVGGAPTPENSYPIRVLLSGAEIANAACTAETIVVTDGTQQEPVYTITKTYNTVDLGTAQRVDYTITVTNIGPIQSIIDQVTDNPDQAVLNAGVNPQNILPSYGTYANGTITWLGTDADRTYNPGQSRQFTYSLTIPDSLIPSLVADGVDNIATVQYDTPTQNDNTQSFEINIDINDDGTLAPIIPQTGIFDNSSRYILFALMFIMLGLVAYRFNVGQVQMARLYKYLYLKSPLTKYENKVIQDEMDKYSSDK